MVGIPPPPPNHRALNFPCIPCSCSVSCKLRHASTFCRANAPFTQIRDGDSFSISLHHDHVVFVSCTLYEQKVFTTHSGSQISVSLHQIVHAKNLNTCAYKICGGRALHQYTFTRAGTFLKKKGGGVFPPRWAFTLVFICISTNTVYRLIPSHISMTLIYPEKRASGFEKGIHNGHTLYSVLSFPVISRRIPRIVKRGFDCTVECHKSRRHLSERVEYLTAGSTN